MKKLLLSGAALVAMTVAAPAQAEGLKLDVAGHFKGYAAYNDFASGDEREFDFRKETEVHFTGETTLDNGLTVGVHVELNVDGDDNAAGVEESYMYLAGGWGRVNFGDEDGAAYLLQVAAPSADSNVDGIRQYISTLGGNLDYDHATAQESTKFTYMTPVFNGFQAGVSYIPTAEYAGDVNDFSALPLPDYKDGYELAARYEGAFEGVGVALGAGYSNLSGNVAGVDDAKAWNVGLDLDFSGFGFGAAYLDESDVVGVFSSAVEDVTTWVVGLDYQAGAYKLGLTYLDKEVEDAATGAKTDEITRWTGGVSYSYGPGMSFRGTVSYIDEDVSDEDGVEVLVGTQINF